MKQWKFALRHILLLVLPLVLTGCSFLEEAARRKILIYDLDQRKVIAVLDHVRPESPWREIFEIYPDFKNKTFTTLQRGNSKNTILRQYTFQGELIKQWDIPERIRWDFSVRGDYLVYTEIFTYDKEKYIKNNGGFIQRLMLRHLSAPDKAGVPISPNPFSQGHPGCNEPPFIFLTDETLLCVMESDDNKCKNRQLWKLSLTTGEKTRLPYSVQNPFVSDCLSSDFSGEYHAAQLSKNEILFLDNDAKEVDRLSVDFRIYTKWWDDNHCFWVYDFLDGEYLCYDVNEKRIICKGNWSRKKDVWVGPFLRKQYAFVSRRIFLGFHRSSIQDLSGKHIASLPWSTSHIYYWGNGLFVIEEN